MPDSTNGVPENAATQQIIDLLKQQQSADARQNETLVQHLGQLVQLQKENNLRLDQLQKSVEHPDGRSATAAQPPTRWSKRFIDKMLIEVPPVVLAVLLAFGINSWWQHHRADQAAVKAYRNIVSEIRTNLNSLEATVGIEEVQIQKVDDQISEVTEGIIDLDQSYGGYFNNRPLRDAAWQAANLSNSIISFPDSLIMDLSYLYASLRQQEEFIQLTLTLNQTEKYYEESLLPFLKVNRSLLSGHIKVTDETAERLRAFLTKYGELEVERVNSSTQYP